MDVKLRDETVRRNVEIFKIILKRSSHAIETGASEKKEQFFRAFVHRRKGEIRFVDLSAEPLEEKEWILVSFRFFLPSQGEFGVSFEISEEEGILFSWDGLDPEALQVFKETVKTIQMVSKLLVRFHNLAAVFREFSQVNLDSFLEEIQTKDLIHEAWHQIDRVQCEKLFSDKHAGTFLFRQDEFALRLQNALMKNGRSAVKCLTLTYLDFAHRTVDVTLIKKKEGWLIYDNDPKLQGPLYPTVKALLGRFRGKLLLPLLNLE